MAAKFGVPVCPHAGGVGLCEYVQHLSIFDYIAVSGVASRTASASTSTTCTSTSWTRCVIVNARYVAPARARLQHRDEAGSPSTSYEFPGGAALDER